MININQEVVKELLLKLEPCDTDFKVIFSGKKSGKINGLYKQNLSEIVIHNKNFKNDNELIYTAIHEYAHHLMWCKYHKTEKVPKHNNEFWSIMYNLVDLAEEKGLYKKYPDESIKKEIQNLVSSAKKINEEIASLYKKLGETIREIRKETDKHEIRIEDILIRECQLSKKTAEMAEKAYAYNIDSSLGQDLQIECKVPEIDIERLEDVFNEIKSISIEANTIKENQSKEIYSLKPISKHAKKLFEKIMANQKLYPVYIEMNEKENTITIRDANIINTTFPEFILLVQEFSYGKEYYPIQEIYYVDRETIKKIDLVWNGHSSIVGDKKQKQSTAHFQLMIEHINRLKKSASGEAN